MKKVAISLIFMTTLVYPKFHEVKRDRSLEEYINQYPYAVVCFAQSKDIEFEQSKEEKQEMKDAFAALRIRIKAAADSGNYGDYLDKQVGFLLVDVASSGIQVVDEEYALKTFPSCMLFKEGRALLSHQDRIFDPILKAKILDLLKTRFGKELQELVQEKKDELADERHERIARHQEYVQAGYPYGYWSEPYWGFGYSYGYFGPYWY